MAHIKGQNVNLLIGGAIVAASTSCDFSLTANTAEASSKSDANPLWDNSEFTYYDWSASNESFVCSIADLKTLITKIATGDCKVQLQFQVGESATSKLICKKGDALLTSLSIDAPADGYATLSLSFEGNGPLTDGTWTAIQTATTTKIKGKALMLALQVDGDYHTLCAATGHKLSISAQTSDTKTKDDNDKAVNKEITGKSMTLSTDNLVDIHDEQTTCFGADSVMADLMAGNTVTIQFGYYPASIGAASTDWEESSTLVLTASCLTTSMSVSGSNKENATFSAEFACKGVPTIA